MIIGVPRALSYYRYFPLWKTLLEGMGAEIVLSRPTGEKLLENGVRHCVDDICVPVKLYYGHALDLAGRCDRLFVSRVVSVEKAAVDTYTCPKLIGLPDMIKGSLEGLPPMLEFVMDVQDHSISSSARKLAGDLGVQQGRTRKALAEALDVQSGYEALLLEGLKPSEAMKRVLGNGAGDAPGKDAGGGRRRRDINIALVGHEYLIHDYYISHDLPTRLERLGANVTYMTQVAPPELELELARYPGISWSYEKELLGAASHFLAREDVDGVMLVIGFACGPDSIIGEIITREVITDDSPPLTTLVLDEHTGEAGVTTRVEAFVDLIRRAHRKS
jgi:predicted nucleotide-binding protein (sugar kinase/HSP70/actin superfamily)